MASIKLEVHLTVKRFVSVLLAANEQATACLELKEATYRMTFFHFPCTGRCCLEIWFVLLNICILQNNQTNHFVLLAANGMITPDRVTNGRVGFFSPTAFIPFLFICILRMCARVVVPWKLASGGKGGTVFVFG